MKNILIDYLFYSREYCQICKQEKSNTFICDTCKSRFEFINGKKQLDYGVCHYPLFYNNFIKNIIKEFKYSGKTNLVKPLGEIMYEFFLKKEMKFDFVTYIPSYSTDEFDRGYNQSELLAREFSKLSGVKMIDLAVKIKKTKKQNKLSLIDREKNLENSFNIVRNLRFLGKTILVVDDLVTTGSTLNVLSKAILEIYNVNLTFFAIASSKIEEN